MGPKVLEELNKQFTMQGYNDGGARSHITGSIPHRALRTRCVRENLFVYSLSQGWGDSVLRAWCVLRAWWVAGLSASTNLQEADVEAKLSKERAAQTEFASEETTAITKQLFQDGLGQAGVDLLEQGVKGLVDDIDRLEPYFQKLAVGIE